MFKSFWSFIQHWYMRYLLVTELYMVEKWERVMIHFIFLVIFAAISMINVAVVVKSVGYFSEDYFNVPVGYDEL